MRRDVVLTLILSTLALASPSPSFAGDEKAAPAAASPTTITIAFKLDPRLSGPTYGGERWVSPPRFTGASSQDVVDARAQATDAKGTPLKAVFKWTPADPEMVSISPSQGQQVKISVKRTGESKLKVAWQEISKELLIKAKRVGQGIQVEIVQVEAGPSKAPPAARDITGPKTHAGPAIDSRKGVATSNKARGLAFLAKNEREKGVVTLSSGLQYKVLRAGEGMTPNDADTVVFHYRGTLIGGGEFASSHRLGRAATVKVARAIPGWREALKLMPVGSRWQLFIPPQLAYGSQGLRLGKKGSAASIGPDETLIYEVDLLAIKPGRAGATTAALGAAPAAGEK